jgi:glycosyltransferase involved in cell wall biosynthesis
VAYDGYEYGLPVVAAKSGGLAEIVMNDETGFLIPPGDSKALANGIVKMLGLPDGGVAMGLQGRKWLEKSATREQWKKEMLSVFTKLHPNSGNLN